MFISCSAGEVNGDPDAINKVSISSPDYIKTKIGTPVSFSLNVPEGSKFEYRWIYNKKMLSTEQNPLILFDTPGTGVVTVIIKDEFGTEVTLGCKVFIAKNEKRQVLSFFPSYEVYDDKTIWDNITHICPSFGVVNTDATIDTYDIQRNSFASIRNDAHAKGVYVLLSIGGGAGAHAGDNYPFTTVILNDALRAKLIDNLMKFLEDNDFDGIDVDYENWESGGGTNNQNNKIRGEAIAKFYSELRQAMGDRYIMTADIAMHVLTNGYFTKNMIEHLDYLNLMLYDNSGRWSKKPEHHADWFFFASSISSALSKQMPKEKLLIGVPFYGIVFPDAGKTPPDMTTCYQKKYSEIVKENPGAENQNSIPEKYIFYDGIPLMTQKTNYIIENDLAGLMIWQVHLDSDSPAKSLLHIINGIIKAESEGSKPEPAPCPFSF
jgi:GH18 family chitinase